MFFKQYVPSFEGHIQYNKLCDNVEELHKESIRIREKTEKLQMDLNLSIEEEKAYQSAVAMKELAKKCKEKQKKIEEDVILMIQKAGRVYLERKAIRDAELNKNKKKKPKK